MREKFQEHRAIFVNNQVTDDFNDEQLKYADNEIKTSKVKDCFMETHLGFSNFAIRF